MFALKLRMSSYEAFFLRVRENYYLFILNFIYILKERDNK